MSQIQRHLKTEELYKEIIALIPEAVLKVVSETHVRGKLDAILSMGKIEGRLTAVHPDTGPHNDRLIEDWQRIVDAD